MKRNKDIKFIIYQSLYIFVICVIAIKGANLDLVEVDVKKMSDPGWTYIDTANKVIIDKNEFAMFVKFDPKTQVIVTIDEWKRQHPNDQPPPPVTGTGTILPVVNDPEKNTLSNNPPPSTQPEKPPPVFGSVEMVKYHGNIFNNKNNYPLTVNGVTVNANSTAKVNLAGESAVLVRWDGGEQTFPTLENKKPQIMFQRMTTMDGESRVVVLQRTVGYRVTINDDFPDQLDVKFSGGVTVSDKGKGVYDITMAAFANINSFEYWSENKPEPFSIGFTVSVKDRIAPHSITGQQSFVFGGW